MWFALATAAAGAPSYTLSFPDRAVHLVDVRAELPASGARTTLFMPTWTPGSYLIREYAQHVEDVVATGPDGAARAVRKVAKNRWEVDTDGLDGFTLAYRVYARQMAVQGNFVDREFAALNGAPTFLVPVGSDGPFEIAVQRPDDWALTVSPLAPFAADGSGLSDRFTAPDLDALIDSPLVVGNPSVRAFSVDGVPHLLVDVPHVEPWDSEKAVAAVQRIVEEARDFWGGLPYPRYAFLNVLGEARGGLEHLTSTQMITSRFATTQDDTFQSWLGLVAHELFHAWNVKRLRPIELGPFDYEREVYTESLWIAEGFTSYYDDVLLARAGLISEAEYLKRLGANVEALRSTPGRLHQPAARASRDAWIEHYRRDEHSANSAMSYYTRGALIAWVLDARIRAESRGKRSLDDAMRLAWARHRERGYTPDDLVAVLSEVAGADLGPLVARLSASTDELSFDDALALFGLRSTGGGTDREAAWLGAAMNGDRVASIVRDGPAWRAGLNVDDEILAVGGDRVSGGSVARRAPGERVELLVARRGRVMPLSVVLAAKPEPVGLEVDPKASRAAARARAEWLGRP